jgi:pyruvate-ferredoxin/flavodoxin oxidoreductase
MTALAEAFNGGERETLPRVIGGRYGLSSKEFGRIAFWPSSMNCAPANLNRVLPSAFMMT